jgi:hypothetical protein
MTTMKTILDGEIMSGHRPWDSAQPKISMQRGYRPIICRDMGHEQQIETGTIMPILPLSGNPPSQTNNAKNLCFPDKRQSTNVPLS